MKSKIILFLVAISYQLLAISYKVAACPLCQAGATKKTQSAYLNTTVLLMSVPIISGGILFFWLKAKYGKGE
ncbi:MAG TPA: hypothetical protein VK808_06065 [Bacteroidia bacterium]|jgi:hypothetical protein|nr:hypothetical protein [Bacteroidia bacterium]